MSLDEDVGELTTVLCDEELGDEQALIAPKPARWVQIIQDWTAEYCELALRLAMTFCLLGSAPVE